MQLDPEGRIKIFYVTEIGRSRSLGGVKRLIRRKITAPPSRMVIFFLVSCAFFCCNNQFMEGNVKIVFVL